MRRFVIALAVLFAATTSQAFAGYIIIRVLLEGGSGDASGGPGDSGGFVPPPSPMAGGSGSSLGPKPGGSGSSLGPKPGMGGGPKPGFPGSGMPGTTGNTTPAAPGDFDHTRSVVVVIPIETELKEEPFEKLKRVSDDNPKYRKFVAPYYGKKLHASLFVDSTSIQFYEGLLGKPGAKTTRHTEMRDKYAQWARKKDDPQLLYDALVLALESGIIRDPTPTKDNSLPKDALHFAQELLEAAKDQKSLPPAVDRFVKAWGAVGKDVRGPTPAESDAETWKARLDAKDVRLDGHYALVYWDSSPGEVTRRSTQLNDNFIAFYLWHATRGVALPVPPRPLVAVLAQQGQQMRGLNHALDGMPIQADAFYAPDHDVLVLSPERLDSVGQTFLQQTQQVFVKGLSRDSLLDGHIPKLDHTGEKGPRPQDVARATTLAVVEKLAVEEAEIAAVSREGSRQLLFATGQLPKHVTLPNWLTNGAVNCFSRPRGPAYVTVGDDDKPYMHVAMTTGYGVPNYVLYRYLVDLEIHKELNADRARLLENVLSDAYFAGIKNGDDPDPAPPSKKKTTGPGREPPKGPGTPPMPKGGTGSLGPPPPMPSGSGPGSSAGPPPMAPGVGGPSPGAAPGADVEDPAVTQRKKRERLAIKAQATAWALYYYLAREKPALLEKYLAEMNKLPRDLPVDGKTAYAAFVRVFGLAATEGGAADPERLKSFAKDWLDYIGTLSPAGFDVAIVIPEPPKDAGNGGIAPMPKGPGSLGPKPK